MPRRHTYSCLTIAQRHPRLFAALQASARTHIPAGVSRHLFGAAAAAAWLRANKDY